MFLLSFQAIPLRVPILWLVASAMGREDWRSDHGVSRDNVNLLTR